MMSQGTTTNRRRNLGFFFDRTVERLPDKELELLAKRYERIRQEWDERRNGRNRQHP